jgi:hypothetical protein
MDDTAQKRLRLQHLMVFLGSVSDATEKVFGSSAGLMNARAAKQLGVRAVAGRAKVAAGDLVAAVVEADSALADIGLMWRVEPWKKQGQRDFLFKEGGKTRLKVVFRDCLVRDSLFHYGHPQGEALCQMAHGYYAGLVEGIAGSRVELLLVHAGENACLKELTWEEKR